MLSYASRQISDSNLARGHDLLVANPSAEISVADLIQTYSVITMKLLSAINSVIFELFGAPTARTPLWFILLKKLLIYVQFTNFESYV